MSAVVCFRRTSGDAFVLSRVVNASTSMNEDVPPVYLRGYISYRETKVGDELPQVAITIFSEMREPVGPSLWAICIEIRTVRAACDCRR
jgi:hypothetical protein